MDAHPVALDASLLRRLARARSPGLTDFARGLATLGSLVVLGPLVVLAAVALVRRGSAAAAGRLAATAVGVVAIVNLTKWIVDRPRPSLVSHLAAPASASFPSQHAAQAAAIMPALAVALVPLGARRRAAFAAACALAAAVGVARVYLGVHYPTDVAAGWLVGAAWVALVTMPGSRAG